MRNEPLFEKNTNEETPIVDNSRVLAIVETSREPAQLRRFMKNAELMNEPAVGDAAFRRLVDILPEEEPGTVEHDFWRSIFSLEQALSDERGKTVRLARTRPKIAKVGAVQTMKDLAMSRSASEGFEMLLDRNMAELTTEAVVLRHQKRFESEVVAAAKSRLQEAGVDVDRLPQC